MQIQIQLLFQTEHIMLLLNQLFNRVMVVVQYFQI